MAIRARPHPSGFYFYKDNSEMFLMQVLYLTHGKDQKKEIAKKKRAEYYEKPLEVNATFIDIINAAVQPPKK